MTRVDLRLSSSRPFPFAILVVVSSPRHHNYTRVTRARDCERNVVIRGLIHSSVSFVMYLKASIDPLFEIRERNSRPLEAERSPRDFGKSRIVPASTTRSKPALISLINGFV
ncbi:unnamed protein product [Lasius platythorax]|uniref:Uncharacterized protein n=1 Tax=Lasius platythorax TaxID=488582 RepID=A0AAV2NFI9_9HYME